AGQRAQILRRQRLVEVEGLAQRADALGRGLVAQHGHGGVARHQPHEAEDQHAHAEQQRHRQQEPAGRVQHQEIQVSSNFSSSDGDGTEACTFGFIQYFWISLLKTMIEPSSWNQRTSSGYIFFRAAGLEVKRKASISLSASSDLKPAKFHGKL